MMVNQSLRWLNEDGELNWRGYYRGEEVASVWPGDLVGNQVSEWCWRLVERPDFGSVTGAGDDDVDVYAAQIAADHAYFLG